MDDDYMKPGGSAARRRTRSIRKGSRTKKASRAVKKYGRTSTIRKPTRVQKK